MRSLDLNLATRPFKNNTLVWAAYVLLLVGAAGFSYWNVAAYRDYTAKLGEIDAEQGNRRQQTADLESRHRTIVKGVGRYNVKSINRRTTKANEVIEWKAFSWTRLFNRLEEMLPYGVRMTSVRPIFRDSTRDRTVEDDAARSISVNVEGVARDWDAFFEIQTKLFEHPSFGEVAPRYVDKEDNGEYAFAIQFLYYPDAVAPVDDDAPADAPAEEPEAAVEPEAETVAEAPPPSSEPVDPDPSATEVADDWAESAEPKAETGKARGERQTPRRRALPRVQPEDDTAGGQREAP